jgi:hypothetical protein
LFQVSVDELKTMLARYSAPDQMAMSGVFIGATKYMYLSSNDKIIRAKKGTSGLHCIKTTQGERKRMLLIDAALDHKFVSYFFTSIIKMVNFKLSLLFLA